jgi:hypothetical protein
MPDLPLALQEHALSAARAALLDMARAYPSLSRELLAVQAMLNDLRSAVLTKHPEGDA